VTDTSLVEFYRRHGISPVHQDISDLPKHFARRGALYRHLGILPAFVRGRSVVEVAPGSGFNSLHTASLGPSRYVLVEANPRGVSDMTALFGRFGSLCANVEIVSSLVETYEPDQQFDFVLCEGLLGQAGVPDPAALLASVARLAAPGGVLVITCIDAMSYLSETLRRLLANLLADPREPLKVRTPVLVRSFARHLATLTGMTRSPEDWVVDNLINPGSTGPLLSIPDAIAALPESFEVFGASPKFLTDWRWYKHIGAGGRFNEIASDEYWANAHNLLDYRHQASPGDPQQNRATYELCLEVRELAGVHERTQDRAVIELIQASLHRIGQLVGQTVPAVGWALGDVDRLIGAADVDADRISAAEHFGPWFGRGQQYLSFSRSLS
jgi:SAM-dependent methyltransferase